MFLYLWYGFSIHGSSLSFFMHSKHQHSVSFLVITVRPLALSLSGIRRHPHPRCNPAGNFCCPEAGLEAQAEGLTDTTIQTQKSPPSVEDFLHSEGLLETGFHRE